MKYPESVYFLFPRKFVDAIKQMDKTLTRSGVLGHRTNWFYEGSVSFEEIGKVIASSDNNLAVFEEGVLVTLRTFSAGNTGQNFVYDISVGGIGDTPVDARLNFLIGTDREVIRDLENELEKFFDDRLPHKFDVSKARTPQNDIGVVIKIMKDGEVQVGHWEWMNEVRKAADTKYVALSVRANTPSSSTLAAAIEHQMFYEKRAIQFREALVRKKLEENMDKILELRRDTVAQLETIRESLKKAKKLHDQARAIGLVASMVRIAPSLMSIADELTSDSNALIASSGADAKRSWFGYDEKVKELNGLNRQVKEISEETMPTLPLPDPEYQNDFPPIEVDPMR